MAEANSDCCCSIYASLTLRLLLLDSVGKENFVSAKYAQAFSEFGIRGSIRVKIGNFLLFLMFYRRLSKVRIAMPNAVMTV